MEKTLITSGNTIDEAIEAALNQLGLDRDNVSVMVLQQAKAGFLGFGKQPAKVQVTYEAPDPIPEAPKVALSSASRSKPKPPVKKPEPKPEAPKPEPKKPEAPKPESPKPAAPKEEPKAEAPKAETPKAPKPERKQERRRNDVPKAPRERRNDAPRTPKAPVEPKEPRLPKVPVEPKEYAPAAEGSVEEKIETSTLR